MVGDIRNPETYAIIGAAMAVHREMGCGFLEAVCQEAMEIELTDKVVPFRRQVDLDVIYRGHILACKYRADFICHESIIVEIKAIKTLTDIDRAQTLQYLKATGYHRALLINFGALSLEYERLVR